MFSVIISHHIDHCLIRSSLSSVHCVTVLWYKLAFAKTVQHSKLIYEK